MGIFSRLSGIFSGDSAPEKKVKTPEEELRLFVTELDWEMIRLRKEIPLAIGEEKVAREKLESQLNDAKDWAEKAQAILAQGVADLAREALVRKEFSLKEAARLRDVRKTQFAALKKMQEAMGLARGKVERAKQHYSTLLVAYRKAQSKNSFSPEVDQSWKKFFSSLNTKIQQIEQEMKNDGDLQVLVADAEPSIEALFTALPPSRSVEETLADMTARLKPTKRTGS